MKHRIFFSRTLLVKDNKFEEASRLLNSILSKEGVIQDVARLRFYEKPWQTRRRINYERCRAIYSEDTTRKVNFVLRKNRTEPYPGCY